jgi:hypothetical protein
MTEKNIAANAASQAISPKVKVGLGGTIVIILCSVILIHYAKWVGDGLYYPLLGWPVNPLHNVWNFLPVRINNAWGGHSPLARWANNGQDQPLWWYTVRHGARFLFIGLFATMLVDMAIQKPLKKRYNLNGWRLIATPFLAVLVAIPVWVIGGFLIYKLHWASAGWSAGTSPLALDINQYTGKLALMFTLLGVAGGIAVKLSKVVKKPADEFQWLIAEESWSRFVPLPGMHARSKAIREGLVPQSTANPVVAKVAMWAVLLSIPLACYGFWLTEFGPAKGAV